MSSSTSTEIDQLLNGLTQNAELLEDVLSPLPESQRGYLLDVVSMKLLKKCKRTGSIDELNRVITMEKKAIQLILKFWDGGTVPESIK